MSDSALGTNGTTARWAKIRKRILERDGRICAYCHGPANTVDHIIPRGAWPEGVPGVDDPSNLTAACKACNSRKGSKVGAAPRGPQGRSYTSREWFTAAAPRFFSIGLHRRGSWGVSLSPPTTPTPTGTP